MSNKYSSHAQWQEAVRTDLQAYGFDLAENNRIVLRNGSESSVLLDQVRGRLKARSATTGALLWSGARIGSFLETFWHAQPQS